ncbi:MAG: hypothetical protein Q4F81_04660 [Eubacteriales bacterium]|nr:hypothetical protein [Eubacteriales bacterium]
MDLPEDLGESRNIIKKADKLFITQSALSERVKAIEREQGWSILFGKPA